MRTRLATLLLVCLVALSGCSLFGGSSAPTPTAADGATSTPTPTATPSPTPTPTPTAVPFQYPPGYASSGVTDPDAATRVYAESLLNTSSYTVWYNATVRTANGTFDIGFVERVDVEDRRAYVFTNFSGVGSQAQYWADGTVSVRTVSPGGDTTYASRNATLDLGAVTGERFVEPVVSDVSYGSATVTTVEGVDAVSYDATDLRDPEALLGNVSGGDVTDFDATLVVDSRGIVRRVTYRATVDAADGQRSLEVDIRVTRLNETTVGRPDWLDRARSGS